MAKSDWEEVHGYVYDHELELCLNPQAYDTIRQENGYSIILKLTSRLCTVSFTGLLGVQHVIGCQD